MSHLKKSARDLILEIRDLSNMTDQEIAEATHTSQTTIGRIRSGAISDTSSETWKALLALRLTIKKAA